MSRLRNGDMFEMKPESYIWIYIAVMALSTYLCRVFALAVVRRPIRNRFVQSFLYYVPYVTLAVMTFPAIVEAVRSPIAGVCAFIVGIVTAWLFQNLFLTAGSCCLTVFILEALRLH